MKVLVLHDYYGCATGCCGHTVSLQSENGEEKSSFAFSHPFGDDPLEFAKKLVEQQFGAEHVKDLDWENCLVLDV